MNTKLTIIVTLLASFIGGAFGFGGSLLIFLSSQEALVQARSEHFDDVRREIYTNFAADSTKVRNGLNFSSVRAIAAGQTLNLDDCNVVDLFAAQDPSLARMYLIAPEGVNDAAYSVSETSHDWFNAMCIPGSSYTQKMRDSALVSFNSALSTFRTAADSR